MNLVPCNLHPVIMLAVTQSRPDDGISVTQRVLAGTVIKRMPQCVSWLHSWRQSHRSSDRMQDCPIDRFNIPTKSPPSPQRAGTMRASAATAVHSATCIRAQQPALPSQRKTSRPSRTRRAVRLSSRRDRRDRPQGGSAFQPRAPSSEGGEIPAWPRPTAAHPRARSAMTPLSPG